jgi:hypothetical protein
VILGRLQITELFAEGTRRGWKDGELGDYVLDDCYGTSEETTDDQTGTKVDPIVKTIFCPQ